MRQMMLELVQQPQHFQQWFGEFIYQSRHELDIAPPGPPYKVSEIYQSLQQGESLQRLGVLRVLRSGGQYFINDKVIDTEHLPAVYAMCHNFSVDAALLGKAVCSP